MMGLPVGEAPGTWGNHDRDIGWRTFARDPIQLDRITPRSTRFEARVLAGNAGSDGRSRHSQKCVRRLPAIDRGTATAAPPLRPSKTFDRYGFGTNSRGRCVHMTERSPF